MYIVYIYLMFNNYFYKNKYQKSLIDWKNNINNELSVLKIQSVIRGHFIRRIYKNIMKNQFKGLNYSKPVETPKNNKINKLENFIDNFIKNRKLHFNF